MTDRAHHGGMRLPGVLVFALGLGVLTSGLLSGWLRPAWAEPEAPVLTRMEAGPWRRADAIVHVRVVSVNDVRAPGGALGRQVVRATALESFKGPIVPQQVFTIVVLGQRPTLDPARPSVPYFAADKTSEHVLFLERGAQAHAWSLQTLFDLDGRPGGEHLAVVRLVAAWGAMPEARAKAARIVKDLLRLLTSGGAWSKTYAARELAWLAEARPESFDQKSRRTLQRIAPIGTSRDQRFWTRRALECLVPKEKGEREEAPERDPWRQAFLEAGDTDVRVRLLTKLHGSSGTLYDRHAWWAWRRLEPSLRTWFLDALVESKRSGSAADLRRAYGVEDDAETRERIVRALGYLGDDRDVPWLTARVANERLRRSALLALSRIATPAARKALEAAQGEPWADADMAAWIDHLLGRPIPGTAGQGGG